MARSLERQQRRSDELMALLESVAIDDARVCKDAARALDITPEDFAKMRLLSDHDLGLLGWTRRAFEAAWEARKPMSEAAYAVRLAHERTGMRIRQQVERGVGAPQVAIMLMPHAAPPPTAEQRKKAPVIDVGGEK